MDTELVRKLASKTIAVPASPEKGKKSVPKTPNGVTASMNDIRLVIKVTVVKYNETKMSNAMITKSNVQYNSVKP